MKWAAENAIHITLPNAPEDNNYKKTDSFSVWLIRYRDYSIEKVQDGDGNPRVLRFTNVVEKAKHVGKWHGKSRTIEIEVPVPDEAKSKRGGYVVLVHEVNGSDIYAAGKLPDFKRQKD
jgi:hypothetical protein